MLLLAATNSSCLRALAVAIIKRDIAAGRYPMNMYEALCEADQSKCTREFASVQVGFGFTDYQQFRRWARTLSAEETIALLERGQR